MTVADRSRNSLVEALLDIADSYSGAGVGAATGRQMAAGAGAGGLAGRQMSEGRTLGALAGIDANAAQAQGFFDGYNTLAGLDEMARFPGPVGPGGGSQPGYEAALLMSPFVGTTAEGGQFGRDDRTMTPLGRKRLRDGWESPEVDAANAAILRAALTRG